MVNGQHALVEDRAAANPIHGRVATQGTVVAAAVTRLSASDRQVRDCDRAAVDIENSTLLLRIDDGGNRVCSIDC